MKFKTGIMSFALVAFALSLAVAAPIDDIGALSVQGTKVVGANGQPAQLRGMSFFWNISENSGPYWNADVVNWLAEDWHANLVRAAMAVEDWWGEDPTLSNGAFKGFLYEPEWNRAMVETIVDAAIEKGIYVIIDWHSHYTNDNSNGKQDSAVIFFSYMAQKYGQYPNVIYEIYNEPKDVSWENDIKPYAEKIIPVIRQYDPDNLIVVGTPMWSGRPDEAAAKPLENVTNVAYTFHFYASDNDHLNNFLPAAKSALQTIPLFVTECGLTQSSGDGEINYTMVNTFWDWIDQEKISWAAWSIVNKNETSAALYASASTSGNWTENDLRESGKWLRSKLRGQNPEWTPITGEGPKSSSSSSKQGESSNSQVVSSSSTQPVSSSSQETGPQSSSSTPVSSSSQETNPQSSSNTPADSDNPGAPDNSSTPDASTAIAEFHNATGFLFAANTISVSLKGRSKVELLDLQGRTVSTLWNGNASGNVILSVQAKPGIYLVRIQGEGFHETHKVAVK